MKTYRCGGCDTAADAFVSLQGGRRSEMLPQQWTNMTLTAHDGPVHNQVLCPACTAKVRGVLSGVTSA